MGARRKNQIVQDTSWAAQFPQRGNCADLQASRYQLQLLAMQGSQIIPNIKILSDNLNTCATTIQKRNLFQKLSDGLILDGENVSPFWNELSSKLSSGLSLPTATDSALKATNWLSGYASTMQSNSWFSSVQSKVFIPARCYPENRQRARTLRTLPIDGNYRNFWLSHNSPGTGNPG